MINNPYRLFSRNPQPRFTWTCGRKLDAQICRQSPLPNLSILLPLLLLRLLLLWTLRSRHLVLCINGFQTPEYATDFCSTLENQIIFDLWICKHSTALNVMTTRSSLHPKNAFLNITSTWTPPPDSCLFFTVMTAHTDVTFTSVLPSTS